MAESKLPAISSPAGTRGKDPQSCVEWRAEAMATVTRMGGDRLRAPVGEAD